MSEENTSNLNELTKDKAVTPTHPSSPVPTPVVADNSNSDFATNEPPEDFFVAEEYGDSFAALSKSIQEGRDLKKKRKALDDYNKTLDTLKLAHADRIDIAENFDSIVAEQENIKQGCLASVAECNSRSQEVEARIAKANGELAELKRSQEEALKPVEDELNRREAMLKSAKEEYKQVRSQRDSLDQFDEYHEAGELNSSAHDQIVSDVESKYEAAKEARHAAQKALDAQLKSNKVDQKVILDSIKKMNSEKDVIAKEAAEFQKKANAAAERIEFCKFVIEHPEQTQSMHERILENEKTSENMAEQISQLAGVYNESVKASSKARTVVIVGIVAVVIVIALFIYLAIR